MKVLDLTGRLILEQSTLSDTFTLDLEILKSGLYFIKILGKNKIYYNFTVIKK
ncbi:MAG: T9SS type A sorting domain-containing protein [Saprospiraceae bacterium]|nr:T9SS type A sorting domain-containing protein [Saprospiraceae bacterium]MBK7810371.1 T9SS type A sorting domain-containing protein [Saprospiraceae bacterium]MBK9629972.1 T9SS type A sorting domain-containing protein [Saprospiraceae bacterium]